MAQQEKPAAVASGQACVGCGALSAERALQQCPCAGFGRAVHLAVVPLLAPWHPGAAPSSRAGGGAVPTQSVLLLLHPRLSSAVTPPCPNRSPSPSSRLSLQLCMMSRAQQ